MSNKAVQITDANFNETILNAKLPALVEAWHPGCGSCKPFALIVEQIACEFEGKMVVAQMNTMDAANAAAQLKVGTVPSLYFFFQGKMVKKDFGPKTVSDMKAVCESFLTTYCAANIQAQRVYEEALRKAAEKRDAGVEAWRAIIAEDEPNFPEYHAEVALRPPLEEYVAQELAPFKTQLDAGQITSAEFKQHWSNAFNELANNPPEHMIEAVTAWIHAVQAKMRAFEPASGKWNEVYRKAHHQFTTDVEEAERQLKAGLQAD
jgi:thioredoxin 1